MKNGTVISVNKLRKVFDGTLVAVDDVSFDIRKGEVFSMLGPNGAGKTTTVEILEGLQSPTSGKATVLGKSIREGFSSIRGRMGILPQEFEPFDLIKPLEFLRYFGALHGRKLEDDELMKLLKTVGLADRPKHLAKNLSGGEKRKLGIAIALVSDPELLFLDEPTTGLDAQARRSLWALITSLKEAGKTIFLTTHYLEEAEELSDRVAIMNKGKLIALGTPRELIEQAGGEFTLVLDGTTEEASLVAAKAGFDSYFEGTKVKVKVPRDKTVRDVLASIEKGGARFSDFHTDMPTLENAFLSLVGAKLENGELKR